MKDDIVLTRAQAAALLTISPRTLEKWAVSGGGPRFIRLGARVGYLRSTVIAWAEAQQRNTTSDLPAEPITTTHP